MNKYFKLFSILVIGLSCLCGCTKENGFKEEEPDYSGYKCVRAKTLHQQVCERNSNDLRECGRYLSHDENAFTYGNLGTKGTLSLGDAFDCDVNGDGKFDSETERFYYVTDLEKNKDYAVLIYYTNTSEKSTVSYYANSSENWHGPETAKTKLPTTQEWNNITLANEKRDILGYKGSTKNTDGHLFPTNYSYEGYATRLLTLDELGGCIDVYGLRYTGKLKSCLFLLENTDFVTYGYDGYWLETPSASTNNEQYAVAGYGCTVVDDDVNDDDLYGVRPVIEVLKEEIFY